MEKYIQIWDVNESLPRREILQRAELLFPGDCELDNVMEFLISQDLIITDTNGWQLTNTGKQQRKEYELKPIAFAKKTPIMQLKSLSGQSPWEGFRKLLNYYIDCVKFGERPSCHLNSQTYNLKYIFPVLPHDWLTLNDSLADKNLCMKLPKKAAPLLRNIVASRESQGLFIGYPVQVFSGNNGKFLSPVCIIPCEVQSQMAHDFQISPQYVNADFNSQWLDKSLGPEQRNAILMGGLIKTNDDDEEACFDLVHALAAISSFLGDKLHGELEPEQTLTSLDMDTAENGIYNIPVLFIGEKLKYSLSLLRELKKISTVPDSELDKTALAYIFRNPAKSLDNDADSIQALPFLAANQEQEQAINMALNSCCTQITGPPGTGKSQATSNLIANLVFYGKSALFSSRNHKAVEAVVARCAQLTEDIPILRSGNAKEGEEFNWTHAIRNINNIITKPVVHGAYDSLRDKILSLVAEGSDLKKQAVEREILSKEHLGRLNETWQRKVSLWPERKLQAALDENQHPCQREVNKIIFNLPVEDLFKNNSWWYRIRQKLWQFFKYSRTLQEVKIFHAKSPLLWNAVQDETLPQDLVSYAYQAISIWKEFKVIRELHHEIFLLEEKSKLLCDAAAVQKRFQEIQKELLPLCQESLELMMQERFANIPADLKDDLQKLQPMLRQQNSPLLGNQSQTNWERFYNSTLKKLMPYYPAWASTLLSLRRTLPLTPAVVDYAIIDEASQCEIPPVIPALYRASRAVIVGDPNQFRPVITLSSKRHEYLKFQKHGIRDIELQKFDYISVNTFDIANLFPSILLRDHFRCHEVIADYFNKTFYNGNLYVLTNTQRLKLPAGFKPGVVWHNVSGTVSSTTIGPVVKNEIAKIREILNDLKKQNFTGTVGVVSPFKAHARAIEEELSEFYSMNWNFIASTAHSFQGDERDVIIFSPAFQEGLSQRYQWLIGNPENSNLTNVAVSRARALLIIVGNRDLCRDSSVNYLKRLAAYPEEFNQNNVPGKPESVWEERLLKAMTTANIEAVPQLPLAGRRLDFAIPKIKLDIEVDGEKWHRDESGHRKADDLWRDYTLSLLGWKTLRFWVYELRENMPDCINKIKKEIDLRKASTKFE
jgi:very-short-patch-repair endonuclease